MSNLEKVNDKNEILLKHNTLVTARYSLNMEESKIFIYMLYKIQVNLSSKGMFCTISHDEFKRLIPNKNKNSIKALTETLKSLLNNTIYFKKDKPTSGSIWGHYNFISGFEFDDELKEFNLECSSKVYDILMNHNYEKDGYYTPINLLIWLQLKSTHTQRLYDFIRLWANCKNVITYDIDLLKELMMLENKYIKYNDFKKRVLIPSIKELNDTGYFKISMTENKKDKKVVSIDFIVEDLDKRIYFKEQDTEKEILDKVINITDSKSDKSGIEEQESKKEIYVPDKKVFTPGTLRSFKLDFSNIDFTDDYMLKAFNDSIMITLDRDEVEKVKAVSYKFFKSTLENKIIEYENERKEDIKHKEEMDKFW